MGARISPEARARIAELRAEGFPWRVIGEQLGIHFETCRLAHTRGERANGRPATSVVCRRPGGCDRRASPETGFCWQCGQLATLKECSPHNLPPKRNRSKKPLDKADGGA